jgi:hypothetical protein
MRGHLELIQGGVTRDGAAQAESALSNVACEEFT